MTPPLRIRSVEVFPLAIPMRVRFEHAAATRATADPVVVRVAAEAPHQNYGGHGETLARRYVTGETVETVLDDVQHVLAPRLLEFRPTSFAEALEFVDDLPTLIDGRLLNAARAAVELALLDLSGKVYRRRASSCANWLELPGMSGQPAARYSGIAVGRTPARLARNLRLQRLYGLRDFKLKVAVEGWEERLVHAHRVLRRAIARGRATLRVDANGGWSPEQALAAGDFLRAHGVCALEQPLPPSQDEALPAVARAVGCDLIADESLRTLEEAEHLIERGVVRVLNVRIAKNGGLLPALRIARAALSAGLDVQLGCLVGETSILSAAGAQFIEAFPRVRFLEGAFGRRLLCEDVTPRPLQFGFGGRLRPPEGFGLGAPVDGERLLRLSRDAPLRLIL